MNIYIKAINNHPLLHEGWNCLEEFKNRKASKIHLYETFSQIPLDRNTLLIADIDDTKEFFDRMNWNVDMRITQPLDLISSKYWKRWLNTEYVQSKGSYSRNHRRIPKEENGDFPFFVKPAVTKVFPAQICHTEKEWKELYESLPDDTELIISEVVNFVSEWRVYVLEGKILGIFNYLGEAYTFPNIKVINKIIQEFKQAPIGYSLDVGVLDDGETAIVEINDGWSLGNYGLSPQLYTRLICARWREILEQNPVNGKI